MGKQKYQEKIEAAIAKSPVVSYVSLARIITTQNKVKQYPKQLVRHLILKGKLKTLTKGYYTAFEEISLAVFCFQPAYLGLQDALSHHDLWEQETIPVIITVRKIRTGLRKAMGKNIFIRRIQPKYYFGIEYDPQDIFALPYSDIEKTFIDFVHFKQKMTMETIKEFKHKIHPKKLKEYLKKYPKQTQERVLGLLE